MGLGEAVSQRIVRFPLEASDEYEQTGLSTRKTHEFRFGAAYQMTSHDDLRSKRQELGNMRSIAKGGVGALGQWHYSHGVYH